MDITYIKKKEKETILKINTGVYSTRFNISISM